MHRIVTQDFRTGSSPKILTQDYHSRLSFENGDLISIFNWDIHLTFLHGDMRWVYNAINLPWVWLVWGNQVMALSSGWGSPPEKLNQDRHSTLSFENGDLISVFT